MSATYTKTTIANLAINYAGGSGIAAFGSSETEEAVQVERWYDIALDEALREIRPNFAKKRFECSRDATAPAFGFSYRYTLPTDWIAVLQMNGWNVNDYPRELKVEQGFIYTDDDEAKILYIFRATDTTKYDALFVNALALGLAVMITPALSADGGLESSLIQRKMAAYSRAMVRNNHENRHVDMRKWIRQSEWINARLYSTNG
jgi:hypothetical protein